MDPGTRTTVLHLRSKFTGDYPLINQIILGLGEGYEHIVCYLTDNGNRRDSLLDLGYKVFWLHYRKEDLRPFRYGVVRELDRIIKENGVDIIHAHRHKPTFYGLMAARKNKKVKLVSTVHGMDRTRNISRKLQNRLLLPGADVLVCVSDSVRKDVIASNLWLDPDKLRVIYNGVDLKPFATVEKSREECRKAFNLPVDGWIWGTAGRLSQVKGHSVLLKAWSRNAFEGDNKHLVIAGDGPLRDELEKQARELDIASTVTFLGQISNIPAFLNALDGFVMPSWKEGCPLAVVEAMATGLPIVASRTGGIPEMLSVLTEKNLACLVQPGSSEDFASSMRTVMDWSSQKYRQAVEETRHCSLFFDAERMIAQTGFLYEEITDNSYGNLQDSLAETSRR